MNSFKIRAVFDRSYLRGNSAEDQPLEEEERGAEDGHLSEDSARMNACPGL